MTNSEKQKLMAIYPADEEVIGPFLRCSECGQIIRSDKSVEHLVSEHKISREKAKHKVFHILKERVWFLRKED